MTTERAPEQAPPTESPSVRLFEHGGPEQLKYAVYPLTEPGPHDVVVDVQAIGVTGFDLKYRRGLPPHTQLPGRAFFPLPQQLGREAAGVVQWVGAAVTTVSPGDHVVAVTHPEDPYGTDTARGLGNLSPGIEIPGHQTFGSYARYLVRDERLWLPLADSVDFEQAATLLWAFSTAHRILVDRLRVRLGETVLVLGSTGGMGIAVIQLARLLGARPIAASRDITKTDQLRSLGAFEVLNVGNVTDVTPGLRSMTVGHGVDHVIDFVGNPSVLSAATAAMRLGGSVCIGAGEESTEPLPFRALDFIRLELNVQGIRGARRIDMLTSLELLTSGRVTVPIARRFALADAAEAHKTMEAGLTKVGRVVLIPER